MANTTVIAGGILLIVLVAFSVPFFIAEAEGTAESTATIAQDESEIATADLIVTVETADGQSTDVRVLNAQTGSEATVTLESGDSDTVILSGEEVTVTAQSVRDGDATISTEYSRTYGQPSETAWIAENMDTLLVLLAALLGVVMAFAAVRGV